MNRKDGREHYNVREEEGREEKGSYTRRDLLGEEVVKGGNGKRNRGSLLVYLVMRFEGPALPDEGVTEVADLAQHSFHEGRA